MQHRGPCGVAPGRAVHATARMGRGRAEVEAADPGLGTPQSRHRPEDQLLVQLSGPATHRAADEVGVAGLELAWAQHPPGQDLAAEPGCEALDPRLHAVGEPFTVVAVPDPADLAGAGVGAGLLGDVRVGPEGLGPRRRPGRVAGGHQAGEHERLGRDRARPDLPQSLLHLTERVGDVDGPRGVRRLGQPRDRTAECPVDLHRAGVHLELRHAADDPGRYVVRVEHPAEEVRRRDVRDHGAPGPDPFGGRPDPGRAPRVYVDPDHLGVAPDLTATAGEPAGQRLGEPAGAALGHREADGLPEHGHQQPHQPGARGVERDVGVPGVSGQEHGGTLTTEPAPTELGGRGQHGPHEAEPAGARGAGGEA